jgi:hypothetical protein
VERFGFRETVGVELVPGVRVLVRWDHFVDGRDGADVLVPSVAVVVPEVQPIQPQLDVFVPLADPSQSRLLLSVSVTF